MERYFILVITVTLAGVITQKKNAGEANFNGVQRNSGITAAIIISGNSTIRSHAPGSHYKFKTSAEVLPGKKIDRATICKESIQQMIKNLRRRANKMPGRTNPRILFNILRTQPLGEPYFIQ